MTDIDIGQESQVYFIVNPSPLQQFGVLVMIRWFLDHVLMVGRVVRGLEGRRMAPTYEGRSVDHK